MSAENPAPAEQVSITKLVDLVNATLPKMSKSNPARHLLFQLGHGIVELGNRCEVQQRRLEVQSDELTQLRAKLGAAETNLRDAARAAQRGSLRRWLFPWSPSNG